MHVVININGFLFIYKKNQKLKLIKCACKEHIK